MFKYFICFLFWAAFVDAVCASDDNKIFPKSLDWNKVVVVNESGVETKIDSETTFLLTTHKKAVLYRKGTTTKSFKCNVDALFWIFKNELSTSSHFGDQALKELYRSKL